MISIKTELKVKLDKEVPELVHRTLLGFESDYRKFLKLCQHKDAEARHYIALLLVAMSEQYKELKRDPAKVDELLLRLINHKDKRIQEIGVQALGRLYVNNPKPIIVHLFGLIENGKKLNIEGMKELLNFFWAYNPQWMLKNTKKWTNHKNHLIRLLIIDGVAIPATVKAEAAFFLLKFLRPMVMAEEHEDVRKALAHKMALLMLLNWEITVDFVENLFKKAKKKQLEHVQSIFDEMLTLLWEEANANTTKATSELKKRLTEQLKQWDESKIKILAETTKEWKKRHMKNST